MQTFLPYQDFKETARCLDYRRLGKQRVECLQILKAISDSNYGWQNHPAVIMWKPYIGTLVYYGIIVCLEWKSRGYKDTCLEKIQSFYIVTPAPWWLGNIDFHRAHQSNLLRKNFEYYSQYNWAVPDNLPYLWPTNNNNFKV